MGFPIKKRVPFAATPTDDDDSANGGGSSVSSSSPCGLDLLVSAATKSPLLAGPLPRETPADVPSLAVSSAGQEDGTCSSAPEDDVDVPPRSDAASPPAASSASASSSSGSKPRATPFPETLRDILAEPSHQHIASWLPHGRSFAVRDTHAFSTIVLPKYFRKVVFRSFARKLNRWGFRSVRRTLSGFQATFEHPLFVRDRPDLLQGMKCRSNPAAAARRALAENERRAACRDASVRAHDPHGPHRSSVVSPSAGPPSSNALQGPGMMADLLAAGGASSSEPLLQGNLLQGKLHRSDFHGDLLRANLELLRGECPVRQPPTGDNSNVLPRPAEERLAVRLRDELFLREVRRRDRERAILRFLLETPVAASDAVSRHIAQRLCRQVLQRGGGGGC